MIQPGLFDMERRLENLSKFGDPLERLTQKGLIEELFSNFDRTLKDLGYLAMSGQIVDASIISPPRQRMTKAEKETVKRGETPEDWKAEP